MRERRFRDSRRRSPPRQKFRDSPIGEQNRPGMLPPKRERTTFASTVVRPDCDNPYYGGHGDDRSCNILQCHNNTVFHGESASSKFQWNNLLGGKFDNAKSPMKTVDGFDSCSYGISAEKGCPGDGFADSGVVPMPTSIGGARNYRHIDGGFTSTVGKNEVVVQNNSEFPRRWEPQYVATNSPRQLYNRDGGTTLGSRVSLGFGVPISQQKVFPNASSSNLKDDSRMFYEDDNLPRRSLGFSRSIQMADGYFAQDGHVQIPDFNATETSKMRLVKMIDRGRVQPAVVQIMDADSRYAESERSETVDVGILPDDILHRNMTRLQGDYRHQDFRRPLIMDSIVDSIDGIPFPSSHGTALRKGLSWEEKLSTGRHSNYKYDRLTRLSSETENYAETIEFTNHPEYGTEVYKNTEGWSLNAYRRDANTANYLDSCKELPVHHDQLFYEQQGSPNGMLTAEELAMCDLDGEMFNLKHSTNENQIGTNLESRSSCSQYASDTVRDLKMPLDEDMVNFQSFDQLTSLNLPMPAKKKHKKFGRKSVKQRLRPARTIPPPDSLLSSSRNVHQRLGPRVVTNAHPFAGKYKKCKILERNELDFCGSSQRSDLSKDKVKFTKTEPPEDSKELKQLVHNAFLKFVKLLNENTAQRRKYTDHGGTGTLKCSICGSESKEFVDTLSLAMHAYKSSRAGCRAEHLGFHKALCLLLGWSDTAAPDGSWVQQMLPAAEAAALKNDLIIWPPVVLLHNSSILHGNPDERMIVSIEGLEAMLVGLGFGGGKTKVSRGKAANHSIFVVTFNATFSGLQAAERLDKFYSDNKRGRAELQQMDSSGLQNRDEKTQYISGDKESVLYGYLGNAGDLDKLDFESKKYCLVRSKKEILAIADATVMADGDSGPSSFRKRKKR